MSSSDQNNAGRIGWIDFGKGFTILCVVIYHTSGAIYPRAHLNPLITTVNVWIDMILSVFMMPVFFALSGYLYKPGKILVGMKKRASSLLIPFFLFTLIQTALYWRTTHSLKPLYVLKLQGSDANYTWFLITLFFVYLYLDLFMKLKISEWIRLATICVIFLVSVKFAFPLSNIFIWGLPFYMGKLYRDYAFLRNKFLVLGTLLIMVVFTFEHIINLRFYVDYNRFILLDMLPKLASIFVFFYLFQSINSGRIYQYLRKYGQYSLVIYLCHWLIIQELPKIFQYIGILRFVENQVLFSLIALILGWGGSICVVFLTKKMRWISFCFYPNKVLHQ